MLFVRAIPLALLAIALLPAAAMAAKVGTATDSRFGTLLVDGRGHTLYAVTKDGRGPSQCYGNCARAWPPFYTSGKPTAIGGAKASYLGTTKRRGGRRQVTYRGRPLYFYIGEKQAGQILCQNVFEFGGFWRILRANGAMVTS